MRNLVGDTGTCPVPNTFSDGGHIMCRIPHIFLLGVAFGEFSKIKVACGVIPQGTSMVLRNLSLIQVTRLWCYGKKYLFIWLVGQDTFPHLATSEMPTWVRPWM